MTFETVAQTVAELLQQRCYATVGALKGPLNCSSISTVAQNCSGNCSGNCSRWDHGGNYDPSIWRPAPGNAEMPYADYLRSAHWLQIRRLALTRAGRQCQRCYATNRRLDVHHLTYARLGDEAEADLIVLCSTCHEAEHGLKDDPSAKPTHSAPGERAEEIRQAILSVVEAFTPR